jgi:diacylglycerol kinase family enzyme
MAWTLQPPRSISSKVRCSYDELSQTDAGLGHPMKVDICSFVQDGKRSMSFMSQALGIMADLDVGTDHLRWMGESRFIYGLLKGGE